MKLVIERETVKRAIMAYVLDKLIKEEEYEVNTAKTSITKGGLAEVTIERKQPVLIDIEDKGEEV